MLADDPAGLCANRARGEHILVFLDREDLAANEPRHADPVEKAEDNEHRDHVRAQRRERGAGFEYQHLIEDRRQQNDDQHIGKRIDDIDDTHEDEVDAPSRIARDTADDHADDEHDDARKKADDERDSRAVDDADEVVAALLIGSHDVREARAALVDELLLGLAVGERRKVLCALVALAVDGEDLLIAVGHDHRGDDDGQNDGHEHNDARHSQRVFKELAHAVFEEGRALAHDVLLPLFVFCRLFKL